MKRTFIEFQQVTQTLDASRVSDDALRGVQRQIMEGSGEVIPGTNGLRKIRCAASGRGKSGGVRIIFADYPEHGACLFLDAFAKNVKGNVSKAERQGLAKLKAILDQKMSQIRK